jgi:hypothetical protein
VRTGMVSLRRAVAACDIGWDFAGKDVRRPATYVKGARMEELELAEAAEVATDTHDDKNRPPILSQARDAVPKRFGADVSRALVLDNPAAIVVRPGTPYPTTCSNTRHGNQRMCEKRQKQERTSAS